MRINMLIKKAKSGDKQAFSEIISFFEQDLYKIAKTRLKEEEDIYDAIQETIITIYESINKLSKVSSFKSWMIKILINKCNDIYRKNNNFKNVINSISECDNYVSTDINNDLNIGFDDLIKPLNYEERVIVILYYMEGYKTREISEILKIKHNTVRSMLLRAKSKLKDFLKEEK